MTACTTNIGIEKAPHDVWEQFSRGQVVELMVVFNDAAILAEASQLNKSKGIAFDDASTLQFKAMQYAKIKTTLMQKLPAGQVAVIRNYDQLPMMFLRFHSAEALKKLLSESAVVRTFKDRHENLGR